jgi:peroxiredoxin
MDPIIGIGKPVPTFTLDDLNGVSHSLGGWRHRVTILNFWSAECPWTERTDRELLSYLADWGEAVYLVPIAANKNEPLAMLKQAAAQRGLPLVLHDNEQRVADLYGAETTPHLFVVDIAGLLRYQGALDDVTFRQRTPTQAYLRQAVEALLGGRTPNPEITPAYGCTIVRYTL